MLYDLIFRAPVASQMPIPQGVAIGLNEVGASPRKPLSNLILNITYNTNQRTILYLFQIGLKVQITSAQGSAL